MPVLRLIIELVGLTLGATYLCFKHRDRVRDRLPTEDPKQWTGHGIEVCVLRPRVEQVRQDYLGAHPAARGVWFHRSLLELARRAVIQLGYFQRREPDKAAHKHEI